MRFRVLTYSAELQWTENALCHRYYSGFPDRIQNIISTRKGGKPSTFQTLYSTAVSIDNHYWERKCESERAPYSAPQRSLYPECSESVTNFIRPYLHQFFDDSHGLKASLKPFKRPFDRYQSRLEAISIGRDIRQINW